MRGARTIIRRRRNASGFVRNRAFHSSPSMFGLSCISTSFFLPLRFGGGIPFPVNWGSITYKNREFESKLNEKEQSVQAPSYEKRCSTPTRPPTTTPSRQGRSSLACPSAASPSAAATTPQAVHPCADAQRDVAPSRQDAAAAFLRRRHHRSSSSSSVRVRSELRFEALFLSATFGPSARALGGRDGRGGGVGDTASWGSSWLV